MPPIQLVSGAFPPRAKVIHSARSSTEVSTCSCTFAMSSWRCAQLNDGVVSNYTQGELYILRFKCLISLHSRAVTLVHVAHFDGVRLHL
jgi:hypothetical protein